MNPLSYLLLLCSACAIVHGFPATDDHTILVYSSSATTGLEANAASALGFNVHQASDTQWGALTATAFATYRALVIGDPNCLTSSTYLNAAIANMATWASVLNGNVIIIGTDPSLHQRTTVIQNLLKFASSKQGKTGLYMTLSCIYHFAGTNTPLPWMDPLKGINGGPSFNVYGAVNLPALNNVHIVVNTSVNAAQFGSLVDSQLANWDNSVHEAFNTWPTDYTPFAIALASNGPYVAADGTRGYPYILTRGDVALLGCQANQAFINGVCVTCVAGSSSTGGACVCNNGNTYPNCITVTPAPTPAPSTSPCGSGCTSLTVSPTVCEASRVHSSGHCATLAFDPASTSGCIL